jgi:hypothetical protein
MQNVTKNYILLRNVAYALKHLITMASLAAGIYYMNQVSPTGNNWAFK